MRSIGIEPICAYSLAHEGKLARVAQPPQADAFVYREVDHSESAAMFVGQPERVPQLQIFALAESPGSSNVWRCSYVWR